MELTGVQSEVPLLRPPAPRSNFTCFHWLSVCSFVLLLLATTIFALLHFQIIPTPGNQPKDEFEVPQVLHLRTFLERQSTDVTPHTQAMNGQRLAAHLTGKVKDNQIQWAFTPVNTFKSPKLKLTKENTLVIPNTGLYFVYTQVVYTGRQCNKIKELTHTVNRNSEEKVTPLLTSTKTACEKLSPTPSVWHQPIYQGGLFQLEEGDILSTETTNIHLLDQNNGQVYFGVLAL